MESWSGRLLVATPAIAGGVFARSVVYLLDHNEDGALGVIVNRPLEAEVGDLLPEWVASMTSPTLVFRGGPVQTDAALAVGATSETGEVGLVDLDGPPPAPQSFTGLRLFAGYAGWSPGQLEGEVEEGSWLVLRADRLDLFSRHPESLWHDVVRRQQGDLRFWSTLPDDPGLN